MTAATVDEISEGASSSASARAARMWSRVFTAGPLRNR
jgi:hypothetical protein